MKVNEIFESVNLNLLAEGVSFSGIQNVIYDYVLNNMKLDKETLSYAKELVHSTDQFWVHEFDDVLSAFERSKDIYVIEDELTAAVCAVSEAVVEYFGNAMNHPPGYKTKKLSSIEIETVKEKDLHGMIEKIDANYMKKLRDEEAAAKVNAKKVKAEQLKSITPERLEQVAKFVKKNDAKGWKLFYNVIKRSNTKLQDYVDFKVIPEAKIKAVKSADELKSLYKNLDPKIYVDIILDNFWNIDGLEKDDEFHGLRIIASNKGLCTKLVNLLN